MNIQEIISAPKAKTISRTLFTFGALCVAALMLNFAFSLNANFETKPSQMLGDLAVILSSVAALMSIFLMAALSLTFKALKCTFKA